MVELAALCIVVVFGLPLLAFAAWLAIVIMCGIAKACIYAAYAPFWIAYQILVMFAHLARWIARHLWQATLVLLDVVGVLGIKAYRLAQRLAAR